MNARRCCSVVLVQLSLVTLLLLSNAMPVRAQTVPDASASRDYNVALGFLKKKLYPQAAARWTKFIQTYPKHERLAFANYYLGICQFHQKQLPQAAATFRIVLTRYPKFKNADGAQFNLALALYNTAGVSKKPADFQKAAVEFSHVATKFAKSKYAADSLYYQAESLYQTNDKLAAVSVYSKLIAAYPTSGLLPDVYYALGTAQQELNRSPDAAKTFLTFLAKFPKHELVPECQFRLGIALFEQKKYPDSEKAFAQAAVAKGFAFADLAVLKQAESAFEQNKLAEAAVLYESIPKRFKDSQYLSVALLAAGKSRYLGGQWKQAQANLVTVVTLKKEEVPEAAYWLGRSLIQVDKAADAVKTLEQAISNYSKSDFLPQLVFARIDALYEQPEQRKTTTAQYADFAAKYPSHTLAADALYRASLVALELSDYAAARKHSGAFLANSKWAKHTLVSEVVFIGGESLLLSDPAEVAKAEPLYRRLIEKHPKSKHVPQARLRIGFCLYSAKKYAAATTYLTTAIGQVTGTALRAEAHLLIGRSHSDQKRHAPAIAAFKAGITAKPDWSRGDELRYLMAISLRTTDNPTAAVAQLNDLNQRYPQSTYRPLAFYQLGEIAFDTKKYDAAVSNYRQVVAGNSKSEAAPLAQYGIGSALFQKGDFQAAVVELSKLLTNYPQADIGKNGRYLRGTCYQRLKNYPLAIADITAFLVTKPAENEALDAQFALALCQSSSKQHAKAIQTIRQLLQKKPDYRDAAKAQYELAFALLETKQTTEAIKAFEQLAQKHPNSPLAGESMFRVGSHHEAQKKWNLAAAAYQTGLLRSKDAALRERLHYKLGWAQYEESNFVAAGKTFQSQIKEFPKGELQLDATYMIGESFYHQRKYAEALPLFNKVIALKPVKYHARSLYRSGDCAANIGQWPQSQKSYEQLASQFPKFEQIHEARYGLGFALQKQNKLDAARTMYESITKVTNTETAAKSRFMMGECAFAQKKFGKALEDFLEAALGYPYQEWQVLGHFEAGRCFIQLKQVEKAKEELTTVVKKFPDHARAKDAAQLLAGLKK